MTSHPQSQDNYKYLVSILEKQTKTMKSLLACAKKKQEAILARRHEDFEHVLAREAPLVEEAARLEAERTAGLAQWLPGEAPADIHLSDVLQRLPEDEAAAVQGAADSLLAVLGEVDAVNQQNAGLMVHSIAHVQTLIATITGEAEDGGTYGPGSGEQSGQSLVEWRV